MERGHLARPRVRGFARTGAKHRTFNKLEFLCGVCRSCKTSNGQARCLRSQFLRFNFEYELSYQLNSKRFMDLNNIFFNQHERLRSGWRFALFLAAFFFLSMIFVGGAVGILSNLPIGFTQTGLLAFVVPAAISAVICLFLGSIFGKFFEDLPFRALGCWFTKNWLKDLVLGLIFGAGSVGFAALFAYAFGGMRFESNSTAGITPIALTLSVTLLVFTVGAINEEILFRGYLLQTMSRAKLFLLGTLLTSTLFASGHLGNPSVSAFAWINTFLAGIWLAVAYYKTRNLWFPFGIHLAWNWVQGSFLGINVSGLDALATAPILKVIEKGNATIGGGDYGLEGGISCTIALIFSTALIYFLPIFKPTEEMILLTSEEKPLTDNIRNLDA